jgi:UDP-N-acetylglucosamine transferase subunit ALG13
MIAAQPARGATEMDPTPPGTESASRVVHQELYAALFVTVGTDSKYRFDRLIDWVDEWLQKCGEVMPSTLVQHGRSHPARFARSQDFLEHDEIVAAIEGASLVITHGGPATIFECWRSHKRPVVVPRVKALEEAVDDHQARFVSAEWVRTRTWVAPTKAEFLGLLSAIARDPEMTVLNDSIDTDLRGTLSRFEAIVAELLRT